IEPVEHLRVNFFNGARVQLRPYGCVYFFSHLVQSFKIIYQHFEATHFIITPVVELTDVIDITKNKDVIKLFKPCRINAGNGKLSEPWWLLDKVHDEGISDFKLQLISNFL